MADKKSKETKEEIVDEDADNKQVYTDEEEEEIKERLRSLGYI